MLRKTFAFLSINQRVTRESIKVPYNAKSWFFEGGTSSRSTESAQNKDSLRTENTSSLLPTKPGEQTKRHRKWEEIK